MLEPLSQTNHSSQLPNHLPFPFSPGALNATNSLLYSQLNPLESTFWGLRTPITSLTEVTFSWPSLLTPPWSVCHFQHTPQFTPSSILASLSLLTDESLLQHFQWFHLLPSVWHPANLSSQFSSPFPWHFISGWHHLHSWLMTPKPTSQHSSFPPLCNLTSPFDFPAWLS